MPNIPPRLIEQYKAELLALPEGSPRPDVDSSHGIALTLLTTEMPEDVAALRAERLIGRLWQELVQKRRNNEPLTGVYEIAAEMYANRLGTPNSASVDEIFAPLFG